MSIILIESNARTFFCVFIDSKAVIVKGRDVFCYPGDHNDKYMWCCKDTKTKDILPAGCWDEKEHCEPHCYKK